mmetsp:Transcript_5817/g.13516  ORF Transcript_5817/g.13516 Transcript_5817/m.13516 type:complete len:208 (-) Transcript_5817:47-670(-)
MEEESHEYSKFERDSGTAWNFLHLDCALLKLARTSSVVMIAAMWAAPFLPFVSVIAHLPDFTMHMIILLILSVLELPFCCTFLNFCIALQKLLSCFEIYWLRGLLYWLMAVSLLLVDIFIDDRRSLTAWLFALSLIVVGTMYMLAYCNGERGGARDLEFNEENGGAGWRFPRFFGGGSSGVTLTQDTLGDDVAFRRAALRAAMSTAL